ncbi:MAG TPA: glycoside hydrolase family 97 N-terminal domain-containing protein, partial [Sphingomonas sp.]|nr:glycoside hydrolase family 97 N-terminal domain-containing protein [Sphingomonas sp.]
MMLRSLVAFCAVFATIPAAAQVEQSTAAITDPSAPTVASPDGRITVSVTSDGDGRAFYNVTRGGKPVIEHAALGFLFTDAPKLHRNLKVESQSRSSVDTSWDQPWGEWKTIRDRHNELRVRLKETTALGRVLDVVFRVFDDGVGFRYEFPEQPNLKHANIADELTEFAFTQGGTAWWKPAFLWNREEYLYNRTPLDAVGTAQTVATIKLADGTHVALHEAALVDYSAMNLARTEGNTLRAALTPGAGAPKVSRDLPFATPWRTIVLADDAPGLYMSHITLNLNEPNKLGDVSWVKPGKFVGVWWNMIKGEWTWATGPKHGATTANVKKYIDFAAANKIPGVLVEGWNVGWDGDWFGNGNDMQFDTPTPEFDAAELHRYAKSKGVHLIGHNETGGSASHYDAQLDRAFKYAADHDIPTVKTGYVTD